MDLQDFRLQNGQGGGEGGSEPPGFLPQINYTNI